MYRTPDIAEEIFGCDLLDVGVVEDRTEGAFQPLDILSIGRDEQIEVASRALQRSF